MCVCVHGCVSVGWGRGWCVGASVRKYVLCFCEEGLIPDTRRGNQNWKFWGEAVLLSTASSVLQQAMQAIKQFNRMGPVRIRHSSHNFGWQSSHSVDLAGWQAKNLMASIEIWIQWRNAHKPHLLRQVRACSFCTYSGLGIQTEVRIRVPFG